MARYRCALVAGFASAALVAAVGRAIARLPEVSCERVCRAADVAEDANLAVFFAIPDELAAILEAVRDFSRKRPAMAVLLIGERLSESQLAESLNTGIRDFLSAPFDDREVAVRLRRALGILGFGGAREQPAFAGPRYRQFIGQSPAFTRQLAKLPTIAACDAGVLILGETGTGKELFAQAIHYTSSRAAYPCVAVNCGALPNELVEDELFGHVRGAYTNAHMTRTGLVREAEGGSLFLDDVDCLPLAAQVKVLRFLQEREYRPVGANTVCHANVRVIAASNRDLAALAARGEFRRDLYFRLNVLTVALPPLRERQEDIPILASHFVRHYARESRRRITGLTPGAICKLMSHDWPGNVRELEHVIERAALLAPGPILGDQDIELERGADPKIAGGSLRALKACVVERFERGYIEHLLSTTNGNVTHAARAAGKNRRAFFALIRKYQITPTRFRAPADQ